LPFGVDEREQYPLFTAELIALMRRLIPPAQQGKAARSVIFTARRPQGVKQMARLCFNGTHGSENPTKAVLTLLSAIGAVEAKRRRHQASRT
jgi:hypothetical protein